MAKRERERKGGKIGVTGIKTPGRGSGSEESGKKAANPAFNTTVLAANGPINRGNCSINGRGQANEHF